MKIEQEARHWGIVAEPLIAIGVGGPQRFTDSRPVGSAGHCARIPRGTPQRNLSAEVLRSMLAEYFVTTRRRGALGSRIR
jgi:hypothetical protein